MITVLGATGNTGKRIADRLLAQGEKVRVVARTKEKLKALADKGAEVLAGSAEDAKFLASAFKGSDAVYTLIPPNYATPDFGAYQDKLGAATAQAIQDAGVRKAVLLSSLGADLASGTGPIKGLHRQEKRLRELGIDVLALRPTYFMENVLGNLGMIKHQGINGGAIAPDIRFPQIAAQDIADYAARRLAARDWTGFEIAELLGAGDYSMSEVTTIVGKKIGKPDLKYVQFPYADFTKTLVGFGLSEDIAGQYAEMSKAFNDGLVKSLQGRTAKTTTPTTFEQFAEVIPAVYASV